MYWVLVLSFWKLSKSQGTRVQLWRSVLSYVWDISLMYGILDLCMGYQSYLLGISLMYRVLVLWFGNKKQNYMSRVCHYGGVYCLMFGIFVLYMGY